VRCDSGIERELLGRGAVGLERYGSVAGMLLAALAALLVLSRGRCDSPKPPKTGVGPLAPAVAAVVWA